VWLEGLAVALVWLGLTFWVALAIDYLPVLVGASEMPRAARAVLLVGIAGVLAFIVWRWILRRTFVRLADHSMALLLERQFDRFHDSLLTSVELAEQPDRAGEFNEEMLLHTRAEADEQVRDVRLRRVFSFKPLATFGSIALAFVVTVGAFAYFASDAFGIWVRRMYALQDEPWPRNAHVEVVGVEVKRELAFAGASEEEVQRANFLEFPESRRLQVAKGSSLVLRVRADAAKEVVPDTCTVYYTTYETTPQGEARRVDRGWVNMDKDGEEREGFQYYTFSAKPFKSILNDVHFDVVGFDHRVRDYRVRVVDSPAILLTEMDCVFPGYMVNRQQALWLPRTVELRSGTQLPRGTQIRFRVTTNKPLKEALVVNSDTNERVAVTIAGAAAEPGGSSQGSDAPVDAAPAENGSPQKPGFEFTVDRLEGNLALKATLIDVDGVTNDKPIRLFVTAIDDTPPRVETALRGISSAITPDAQTPALGRIVDDYGVQSAWFEVAREGAEEPYLYVFPVAGSGEVNSALDFRALRGAADSPYEIKEGDKLVVTVKASDFSDLDGEPNVGAGDRYQLDVVAPNQLLAMLEARELGQRRRFEQIIEEMTDMRDSLLRVKAELSGEDNRGAEPEDRAKDESGKPKAEGEAAELADAPDDAAAETAGDEESGSSLRLLRIQRADQQAAKSSQETLGVAIAFEGIREELINNRVDTEERKSRLKELIADPLRNISEAMFPELNNRLAELEKVHADPQQGPAAAQLSIDETERVLTAMNEVLNQMLDLETYNELVEIVRSIIKDQSNIIEDTKKQRRKVLFEP
jgi:hypothetical protein